MSKQKRIATKVEVFYFGAAICSPFQYKTLDKEVQQNGFTNPEVVPKEIFTDCKGKSIYLGKTNLSQCNDDELREFIAEQILSNVKGERHNFVQVECGSKHTLLLNQRGEVFSFGENTQGQLGTPEKNELDPKPTKILFETVDGKEAEITRISASQSNSAAFTKEDRMYLWGGCYFGKLGLGKMRPAQPAPALVKYHLQSDDTLTTHLLKPVFDESLKFENCVDTFKAASFGQDHGVLLTQSGKVFAMGKAKTGRLGFKVNPIREYWVPQKVEFPDLHPSDKVIDVKCGAFHNLAVTKNGSLFSWGEGSAGKLGLGFEEATKSSKNQEFPSKIQDVFDSNQFMSVACGKNMTVAVTRYGTIYTWGKGTHEHPKFNDYQEYSVPFVLAEERQIVHVALGEAHAIALDKTGQLFGWGDSREGCLAIKDTKGRKRPQQMTFFENKRVIDVSCGSGFSVVIAECEVDAPLQYRVELDKYGFKVRRQTLSSLEQITGCRVTTTRVVTARQPIHGQTMISRFLRAKIKQFFQRETSRKKQDAASESQKGDSTNNYSKQRSFSKREIDPPQLLRVASYRKTLVERAPSILPDLQTHRSEANHIAHSALEKEDLEMERQIKNENELFNQETIQKFVESSFNGNILVLPHPNPEKAERRWINTEFIDNLINEKTELHQRLHGIKHSELFGPKFRTEQIHSRLKDLELDEKLRVMDNVFDYVYADFKELEKPSTVKNQARRVKGNLASLPSANQFSTLVTDAYYAGAETDRNHSNLLNQKKRSSSVKQLLEKKQESHKRENQRSIKASSSSEHREILQLQRNSLKLAKKGILPSLSLTNQKMPLTLVVGKERIRKLDHNETAKAHANFIKEPRQKQL